MLVKMDLLIIHHSTERVSRKKLEVGNYPLIKKNDELPLRSYRVTPLVQFRNSMREILTYREKLTKKNPMASVQLVMTSFSLKKESYN